MTRQKIYLHYNEIIHIFRFDELDETSSDITIADALLDFQKKYPIAITLLLEKQSQCKIHPSTLVYDFISESCDVLLFGHDKNNDKKNDKKNDEINTIPSMNTTVSKSKDTICQKEWKDMMSCMKKRQFQKVKNQFKEYISNIHTYEKAYCLGEIAYQNSFYQQAILEYSNYKTTRTTIEEVLLGFRTGQCYLALQHYTLALKTFDEVLLHLTKYKTSSDKATRSLSCPLFNCPSQNDVKVELSKAMYGQKGDLQMQQKGINLCKTVLEEEPTQVQALLLYSIASCDMNEMKQSMQIILSLLIANASHRMIQTQFCKLLTYPTALVHLKTLLIPSLESAPAYAFLATILKDHGQINVAITLLTIAYDFHQGNISYALNLIHLHELVYDYTQARDLLLGFTRYNKTLTLRGHLAASELNGLLYSLQKEHLPIKQLVPPLKSNTWTPMELDYIALWMTAVKILFCIRELHLLPSFFAHIEPIRTVHELHTTSIRNEQAYYSCIRQLFDVPGLKMSKDDTNCKFIYVCGDSHTLATAWRTITTTTTTYLLIPVLVTGLKHWHLRKDSVFYPKRQFEKALSSQIPVGSSVIFLFGEIDCREGLLVAVERCKYTTLQEGMDSTIAIFMTALEECVHKYHFKAYIHPIVPVLDATRSVVKLYNAQFHTAINRVPQFAKWLDFFSDLLNKDQTQLLLQYQFDQTHLHPSYLKVLEKALSRLED